MPNPSLPRTKAIYPEKLLLTVVENLFCESLLSKDELWPNEVRTHFGSNVHPPLMLLPVDLQRSTSVSAGNAWI